MTRNKDGSQQPQLNKYKTKINSMVSSSRGENNNCYCKVATHIKSREKFCLLNVRNSSHSRTCLPENVCKFLFHCYAYVYGALVSMIARLRCAVRIGWRFPCEY
ncbi:hypothetical protein Tsp_03450 [Trichinella spiralis]|uniref:hypothetical protein n=1 Tax=Trichinella spiralis TaxID=6334 RepID=UPI0001EFCFB3|nr:hypothetical protein Tsp_03450 [Trichinella spiralis]